MIWNWLSWQGECRDNVVPGSLLSSGYYEYEAFGAAEYIVHKPKAAGKDHYYFGYVLLNLLNACLP